MASRVAMLSTIFVLLLPCVIGRRFDDTSIPGLRMSMDESILTMGEKEEIKMFRNAEGMLNYVAPKGLTIEAPWIKVNGVKLEVADVATKLAIIKKDLEELAWLGYEEAIALVKNPADYEWKFGKSGKKKFGEVGVSFHTSPPDWVEDADRGGTVAKFDGTDQCIALEDSDGKFSQKKFTVSFWFKADRFEGNQGVVAHGESFTTDLAYWVLRLTQDKKMQLWVEASDDGDYHMESKELVTNKWYHVILTRSDSHFIMYLNGEKHVENANLYNGAANGFQEHHPLTVGCRTNSGDSYQSYFKGSIDHVQWFNKVLTPEDF